MVPSILPGAVDAVVDDAGAADRGDAACPRRPPEALEMARIAAGAARVGVDTGPATLVQEAALEGDAVSFAKGCYLGQETVARVKYRGRVEPPPARPPPGRPARRRPAAACCSTGARSGG